MSLQYNYHDACLVELSYGPRREASFVFDLYPIFYPDRPRIVLRFGGIFNHDSVARYVASIRDDTRDPDAYLGRCNIVQFDTIKRSSADNIYVFLDLEHYGHICIHSRNVSESKC